MFYNRFTVVVFILFGLYFAFPSGKPTLELKICYKPPGNNVTVSYQNGRLYLSIIWEKRVIKDIYLNGIQYSTRCSLKLKESLCHLVQINDTHITFTCDKHKQENKIKPNGPPESYNNSRESETCFNSSYNIATCYNIVTTCCDKAAINCSSYIYNVTQDGKTIQLGQGGNTTDGPIHDKDNSKLNVKNVKDIKRNVNCSAEDIKTVAIIIGIILFVFVIIFILIYVILKCQKHQKPSDQGLSSNDPAQSSDQELHLLSDSCSAYAQGHHESTGPESMASEETGQVMVMTSMGATRKALKHQTK